jgi:hypothetical protein
MVNERKAGRDCGFPKAKKKFINEAGIYCVGPAISAQFACDRPEPLPASNIMLGVDLGVSELAVAFDGAAFEDVAAPRHLRKAQKRLRRARRALSRRRKGSASRRAQARRVGVIDRKVRERRKDLLHQISHRLIGRCGEGRDPGPEPASCPVGGRRRHESAGLQGRLAGRRIVQCDPWFPSSQTCCMCSALHPEMRNLSVRTLSCDCHGPRPRCRGNLFWYPEERENRIGNGPTRVETGDQGLALRCPSVKREYLLMESNNSEEES